MDVRIEAIIGCCMRTFYSNVITRTGQRMDESARLFQRLGIERLATREVGLAA
ncbi:hypothetical protein C8R31_101250 [Nitrosospira sp. Nsp2]|nr:hypothetical protein C8R31_101250 [Nitrosospira sp. Nsp2]